MSHGEIAAWNAIRGTHNDGSPSDHTHASENDDSVIPMYASGLPNLWTGHTSLAGNFTSRGPESSRQSGHAVLVCYSCNRPERIFTNLDTGMASQEPVIDPNNSHLDPTV